jgi:hypothetical protein
LSVKLSAIAVLLLVVGCRLLTAIVGVAVCALSFVECRLLTVWRRCRWLQLVLGFRVSVVECGSLIVGVSVGNCYFVLLLVVGCRVLTVIVSVAGYDCCFLAVGCWL